MYSAPWTIRCVGYTPPCYIGYDSRKFAAWMSFRYWNMGYWPFVYGRSLGYRTTLALSQSTRGICQTCANLKSFNNVPPHSNILPYEYPIRTAYTFTTKFVINDSNFISFNPYNFLLRQFKCPVPTQTCYELRPRSLHLIFVTIESLMVPEQETTSWAAAWEICSKWSFDKYMYNNKLSLFMNAFPATRHNNIFIYCI